jgi:hypothetical protein
MRSDGRPLAAGRNDRVRHSDAQIATIRFGIAREFMTSLPWIIIGGIKIHENPPVDWSVMA